MDTAVMIPKVPSAPMKSCLRSYPKLPVRMLTLEVNMIIFTGIILA